jgi:hypothetical protein
MADLSEQHIESLIDLVEDKLLRMSTDKHERCAEYRNLQNCRYALITMAASANAVNMVAPIRSDIRVKANHLRPIAGGKA